MQPRMGFHNVERLTWTPLQQYQRSESDKPPFWARDLIIAGEGGSFAIPFFSDTADGLLTPEERADRAEAEQMRALTHNLARGRGPMQSTYKTMTVEHLGDNASAADLRWFQLACQARQGETGESDDAVTDWMWGSGDWEVRARQYAAPELVSGEWLSD